MINNVTVSVLKSMNLRGMANALEAQILDPKTYAPLSFEERLGIIVDAQWNMRQDNIIRRRFKDAHLDIPSARIEEIERILKNAEVVDEDMILKEV